MTKEWIATTAQGYVIITSARDKATALAQVQKELDLGDTIEDIGRL